MILRPASWPWLLRHELRLVWRRYGGARLGILIVLGGVLWLGLHAGVWMLVSLLGNVGDLPPIAYPIGGLAVWMGFTLMLSTAISMSVSAFFDRGDLDLLLSSPLPPRHIFIVRGLGVAVSSAFLFALLLTPFAHVGLLTGHFSLLAVYPALASLALLAAAIGMGLTATLVRLVGARRARTAAQVLGALVGAAIFLASQLGNIVSHDRFGSWFGTLLRSARGHPAFGPDSPLWIPFDAMLGGPAALATMLLVGVGAFMLVVVTMARRFFEGTQESVVAPAPSTGSATIGPTRFRGTLWRVVLVKEWKLIFRDPQLIANTLLQALYVLPLIFVWGRKTSPETVILPAIVLAAATLAAGLAWLTVAAEDAPELLAAAPVDRSLLQQAKLVAAVLPVWLLLSPVALYLLATRPMVGLVFAFCACGSTVCVSLIQLALPQRGNRGDMRRRAKGNVGSSLAELATTVGWAAMTWCLLVAPLFALLAAVPALGAPCVAWLSGRGRRLAFAGEARAVPVAPAATAWQDNVS